MWFWVILILFVVWLIKRLNSSNSPAQSIPATPPRQSIFQPKPKAPDIYQLTPQNDLYLWAPNPGQMVIWKRAPLLISGPVNVKVEIRDTWQNREYFGFWVWDVPELKNNYPDFRLNNLIVYFTTRVS